MNRTWLIGLCAASTPQRHSVPSSLSCSSFPFIQFLTEPTSNINMAGSDVSDLILVLIAILFPPITALLTDGCGGQFCLNILLTLLGFIPGLIHAIWLVYRQPRVRDSRGRVQGHGQPQHYVAVNPPPQQPQGQHQPGYGQQYPPAPEPVPAPNAQYYQNQPYGQQAYQPAHGKVQ